MRRENRNAQSHDTTIALIRGTLDRGYTVTEVRPTSQLRRRRPFISANPSTPRDPRTPQCYVDTVGIAADYQKKLEDNFPGIKFVVTSKADAIYPIVSAASIAAKVTRDCVLAHWTFLECGYGDRDNARAFGSGYPSGALKILLWFQAGAWVLMRKAVRNRPED